MEKETLYRFYKGEATSDEQRRLMEWLDADQENRRATRVIRFAQLRSL